MYKRLLLDLIKENKVFVSFNKTKEDRFQKIIVENAKLIILSDNTVLVFNDEMIYYVNRFKVNGKSKDLDLTYFVQLIDNTTLTLSQKIREQCFCAFNIIEAAFGHQLYWWIPILDYYEQNYKNKLPLLTTTYTNTKHLNELLKLYENKPKNIVEIVKKNHIFQFKSLVLYFADQHFIFMGKVLSPTNWIFTFEEKQQQILHRLRTKIYKPKKVNTICLLKDCKKVPDRSFHLSDEFHQLLIDENIILLDNLKLSFNELMNYIYNAKTIIVQYGALHWLTMLAYYDPNYTTNMIVLRHPYYFKQPAQLGPHICYKIIEVNDPRRYPILDKTIVKLIKDKLS